MEMIQPVFENIEDAIIECLSECKYSVHIAMAWMTNANLLNKLIELKNNKVDVRLIVSDDGEINSKSENYFFQLDEGITSVFRSSGSLWDLMHHKFCVIDYQTVITGSFNWTQKAEKSNDENIVIINDLKAASEYSDEFFDVLSKSVSYFEETDFENTIIFRGQKMLLIEGEKTNLIWNVEDAISVKLNGLDVSQSGQKQIEVTQDEIFILSVEFEEGVISKDVLVEYCEAPILSLELDKEYVVEGHQPLTISWKVENADKVYLHPFGEVASEGTKTEFIKEPQVFYLFASNRRFVKKTETKECKVVSLSKIEQIDTPFPTLDLNLSLDLSELQYNLKELTIDTEFNLNLAQSFDELKSQVYMNNEIIVPEIELEGDLKNQLIERVKTKLFKKDKND